MKKTLFICCCLLLAGCDEFETPNYSNKALDSTPQETESNSIRMEEGTELISGVVVDVKDGNQFRLQIQDDALLQGMGLSNGQIIMVNMLMSQAPQRADKLPFGEEAYEFMYDLMMGEVVELEFEPNYIQDSLGNYQAYTYLDGHRLQDVLIENGFAKVRSHDFTSIYENEFQVLELLAKGNSEGIWSIQNYANVEEGFNQLIMESSDYTKEQLEALEYELTSNGNTLKESLFDMIGTDIPQ